MSLHSLCLPGTLQPIQLSQMRMELGEEIRPMHLDMTNLFNLSNQCTAANESYVPDMSNVVNSETLFGLEQSIQAHLGPFQLPASSQVNYRCVNNAYRTKQTILTFLHYFPYEGNLQGGPFAAPTN